MSGWIEAFIWGLLVGSGLIIGAIISYFFNLKHKIIAIVMGFGSGILIAVLAYDLTEKAYSQGGFTIVVLGFLLGALIFSSANLLLAKKGAKHRKRCAECIVKFPDYDDSSNELSIVIGSIMDSIPEAIIVGISLAGDAAIGNSILIGFLLANIPEGLASASGMKKSGKSAFYIFGIWGGVTLLTGIAGLLGYTVFGLFPVKVNAFIIAIAAGGMLSMVSELMIPEAFEEASPFIGLVTSLGFMTLYLLLNLFH